MKLCPECAKTGWPFVVVLFIAAFSAFLTWLTLSISDLGLAERAGGSALAFLAVGGTLLHYVITCMKRHCRHGQSSRRGHHSHGRGTAR